MSVPPPPVPPSPPHSSVRQSGRQLLDPGQRTEPLRPVSGCVWSCVSFGFDFSATTPTSGTVRSEKEKKTDLRPEIAADPPGVVECDDKRLHRGQRTVEIQFVSRRRNEHESELRGHTPLCHTLRSVRSSISFCSMLVSSSSSSSSSSCSSSVTVNREINEILFILFSVKLLIKA
ncbi:unnamed protein product [Pleuronectes platessa]|uniref:Uncharacterized protein n=1 Tax=Pleuronectes platessa TaxID=8262 RepID=A0A9N7Z0S3_PLEPL|nr:unnamed protein product [Pleuronectes platessa]